MSHNALSAVLTVCRQKAASLLVVSLMQNLLMLATPLYMMQVYDRVLASKSVETLILLTLLVFGALATYGVLEALRTQILNRIGQFFEDALADETLRRIMRRVSDGDGAPTARPLRDLGAIRNFLSGNGVVPFLDAPWAPIFLAIVFLIHPVLGTAALLGALALVGLAIGNEMLVRRPLSDANVASAEAMSETEAMLRNSDVVHAMGMLPALEARTAAMRGRASADQSRAGDRSSITTAGTRFVRMALQILMLGLGAWLAINGEINAGAIIAASTIMARAVAPVEQMMGSWKAFVAARLAHARLRELIPAGPADSPGMDHDRPKGALSAQTITLLTPGGERALLKSISLEVAAREVLAVVGPSGAGKSTLARVLAGAVMPDRGTVRLDGIDFATWSSDRRGKYIGYLPQDSQLFQGTVRENIARFTDTSDQAVFEAARLAGAHSLILGLPDGYDTRIGAGGVRLSGGQMQRVGLARAVFGRPALIVLDEPDAHLDPDGEAALRMALRRIPMLGASVVLVTQRPGLMSLADRVLVLREGAVESFGRPGPKHADASGGASARVRPIQSGNDSMEAGL